jgi:hypothetical protein
MVSSPHVITVLDMIQMQDRIILVFEDIEGLSLREYLDRNGPFLAAALCRLRLSALSRAHSIRFVCLQARWIWSFF